MREIFNDSVSLRGIVYRGNLFNTQFIKSIVFLGLFSLAWFNPAIGNGLIDQLDQNDIGTVPAFSFSLNSTASTTYADNQTLLHAYVSNGADDSYECLGNQYCKKSNNADKGMIWFGSDLSATCFRDLNIPENAIIDSAFVVFSSYGGAGNPSITIQAERTPLPNSYSNNNSNLSSRDLLPTKVKWNQNSWVDDKKVVSPDIAKILQDLVDRHKGIEEVSFIYTPDTPSIFVYNAAYNYEDGYAPELMIYYREADIARKVKHEQKAQKIDIDQKLH